MLEAIETDLRRRGLDVRKVSIGHEIRKGRLATSRGSYVVTLGSRADAITAGRIILGSFGDDPEAGNPSVAVFVKADGSAMLCVGWER